MTMTRKEFLQTTAGAIVASTIAPAAPAAAAKPGPKRGVSVYSYVERPQRHLHVGGLLRRDQRPGHAEL